MPTSAPAGRAERMPGETPGAPQRNAGTLTAGMLDDFSPTGRAEYARFLDEQDDRQSWEMEPREGLAVRVRRGRTLLRDHPVSVEQGERRYELRTLPDGTVRLFPGSLHALVDGEVTVTPHGGAPQRLVLSPALRRRGRADVAYRAAPPRPRLDLGLLIDATGSMQDEMSYLQAELRDIVARVQPRGAPLDLRISVVYYRDRGDEFVTRALPFTDDVDATVAFLSATRAGGGGDTPEEMFAGLREMMAQEWSGGPAARMLFLVADAPPKRYEDESYVHHDAVAEAARRGISIFPLAASGTDRPTEYLMRAMAVATGGRYLFLTDDSGVGNPHLTPEQPYGVERLNDLMVREIRAFVAARYPELRRYAAD